ncbi:MAG: stage II sporulation protein R [Ruminococcaceae bacterium]|nr:stage II sporulation protein R [Oscillospiraceae bacterium]
MKLFLKITCTLLLLVFAFWAGSVVTDQAILQSGVIRLHVVADSDSPEDQSLKLKVRDAVLAKVQSVIEQLPDMETAKNYLREQLPELERIANQTLQAAGNACRAMVTLTKEAFPTRYYDTFRLPAGVYESLRVTIGEGAGRNWWCVVFPGLCSDATTEAFSDTATDAGFSDHLTGALTQEPAYRVRFFFLDCLGWVQNWFH